MRQNLLLVEDQAVIAMDIADVLGEVGIDVAASAYSVEEARDCIWRQPFDAALMELKVQGESTYGLADWLTGWNVPTLFLTDRHRAELPERHRDRPRVRKPLDARELVLKVSRATGVFAPLVEPPMPRAGQVVGAGRRGGARRQLREAPRAPQAAGAQVSNSRRASACAADRGIASGDDEKPGSAPRRASGVAVRRRSAAPMPSRAQAIVDLEEANRHIVEGQRRIARLRSLRARNLTEGFSTENVDDLIERSEDVLKSMAEHREAILRDLAANADR